MFSAFIKEVDGKTNTDTIWGKKSSFGSCLSEFSNGRGILDKSPSHYYQVFEDFIEGLIC